MKRIYQRLPLLFILVIFILGASIRFVGLGTNPAGLVDDEVENGYEAYSLLRTGKDEWGASWPVTSFRSFGDYRLPAYIYLTILPVSVLGLTPFAIRFPSALFGSLTIILTYLLTKELFSHSRDKNKRFHPYDISGIFLETAALLAAFFLAISPWHVAMSRVAIEEAVSVFFVTAGLVTLLKGRKDHRWIPVSSFAFGLSLFLYRPNIMFVPFLIASMLILYRNEFSHVRRWVFVGIVAFIIIGSPILFSAGRSTFTNRINQINFLTDTGFINKINEKQGACVLRLPRFLCRTYYNKYVAYSTTLVTNYLYHFSPDLLSIKGTETQYSVLPARGLLYLIDYPLLLLGIIAIFFTALPGGLFIFGMLLVAAVPDSFTSVGHYGRFFISFPSWPIITAYGIVVLLTRIAKWKVALGLLMAVFVLAFSNFLIEYWTVFPYSYSMYSQYGYEELTRAISDNTKTYDQIIVSSRINDSKQYIHYLFYTHYDPAVFQSGKGIRKTVENDGWVRVNTINSINFMSSIPSVKEMTGKSVLLIGAPAEFPSKTPTKFTVKDKKGNGVFVGIDARALYPCLNTTCKTDSI